MLSMRHPAAVFISVSFLASILVAVGCESTARFNVVAPTTARGEVPRNAGAIVSRDKIDYEVFQAEDKVIVRFVNRTGQPLRLTEQSVILDAGGRAFAVDPQDLPPDQSGRLVLPPASAAQQARPSAIVTKVEIGGVDEGGLIGTRRDIQNNDAAGGSTGATAAPPPGFRWTPGTLARVRLIYRVGESPDDLTHEWTIRRTR